MKDMLFVITFDESSMLSPDNGIYTAFYGDSVITGKAEPTKYSTYSLLRTIEDSLGLDSLKANDAKATPISGVWK